MNLPIGVFALIVTLREVAESKAPVAKRPDWPGFVTFTLGLTGLVYGLIRSHPDGWGSTTVVASLTAAVVLLSAFLVVEMRSRAPMLDLKLLRVPTFNGGLIAAFALSASVFSLLTYLVLYLQNVLGSSAIGTGLRLLPVHRRNLPDRGARRSPHRPRAHEAPDRPRVPADRRRPGADPRDHPDRHLEPSASQD